MDRTRQTGPDRGQAYTLEGFVGAIVVLTAVLFALQSVVIMPTTGGPIDRTVQAQLQQEVDDALVVAAANESDENLTSMVRNWDADDERFYNASSPSGENGWYTASQFRNESALGAILYDRFGQRGQNYNVELHYYNETSNTYEAERLVYQGRESSSSFTASHTVALYDEQDLTAPGSENVPLENTSVDDAGDYDYPIPESDPDGTSLYNVVEVRVIVW